MTQTDFPVNVERCEESTGFDFAFESDFFGFMTSWGHWSQTLTKANEYINTNELQRAGLLITNAKQDIEKRLSEVINRHKFDLDEGLYSQLPQNELSIPFEIFFAVITYLSTASVYNLATGNQTKADALIAELNEFLRKLFPIGD